MSILQSEQQSVFLQSVASTSNKGSMAVAAVAQGVLQPIRTIEISLVSAFLSGELQQLANQYGNRQQVDEAVLDECMEIVISRYGHLGLNEIREAYRMWVAKDLGEMKEAEMYGGVYQARHLGAVLSAYDEKRKSVFAMLHKKADEAKAEHLSKQQHEQRQKEFDGWFVKEVANKKGSTESWQDVPEYWYKTALRLGMIEINKEEANQTWIKATAVAKREMTNELQEEPNLITRKSLLQSLELPNSESLTTRAKVIARKMTVFEKLLK